MFNPNTKSNARNAMRTRKAKMDEPAVACVRNVTPRPRKTHADESVNERDLAKLD